MKSQQTEDASGSHTNHPPLSGLRVLELGGIGPVPHAAMILADLGADVLRLQNPHSYTRTRPEKDLLLRNRRCILADLKDQNTHRDVMNLIDETDALLEGFRPGTAERLKIGPEDCLARNPALVYGRMTGWGQDGPLAHKAGHDINYIALNGVLHTIGVPDAPPPPPLNLVADFGGGSMFLIAGVLSALWDRTRTGVGRVVDAAMVDGSSVLMQSIWAFRGVGFWDDHRESNVIDGAAPFYRCYKCADGQFVAVGATEPKFYRDLVEGLGLDFTTLPEQYDQQSWPEVSERLAEKFLTKTRDDWVLHFDTIDACLTPVLSLEEASHHPHAIARQSFVEIEGMTSPAPAPRFSHAPTPQSSLPRWIDDLGELKREWSQVSREY